MRKQYRFASRIIMIFRGNLSINKSNNGTDTYATSMKDKYERKGKPYEGLQKTLSDEHEPRNEYS